MSSTDYVQCVCNDCGKPLGIGMGVIRGVSELAGGEYYNSPEICDNCMVNRREIAIVEVEREK